MPWSGLSIIAPRCTLAFRVVEGTRWHEKGKIGVPLCEKKKILGEWDEVVGQCAGVIGTEDQRAKGGGAGVYPMRRSNMVAHRRGSRGSYWSRRRCFDEKGRSIKKI